MINVQCKLTRYKFYPSVGITIPSDDDEIVEMKCSVESMAVSGKQLNVRYSVYIGDVRSSELLTLSLDYDQGTDWISQAEQAIRNLYQDDESTV